MEENKSNVDKQKRNNKIIFIILICLMFVNLFMLLGLLSLERKFTEKLNESYYITRSYEPNYNNVQNEKSLIIESYDLNLAEKINNEDLTVDFKLSIIPREFEEDSKASIQIGDEVFQMRNEGIKFVAENSISIFNLDDIKFILESQGVKKIEGINNYETLDRFISNVFSYYEGSYSKNENTFKFNGNNIINVNSYNEDQTINKIEIISRKNNEVLKKENVDLKGQENLSYIRIPFKEDIIIESGDTLEVYALIETEAGIIYRSKILKYKCDIDSNIVDVYDDIRVEIVDKNENVLKELK